MKIIGLIVLFLINLNPYATACRILPDSDVKTYAEVAVKNASAIYYGRVKTIDATNSKTEFEVIETIKGSKKKSVIIPGNREFKYVKNDFNLHKDETFWKSVLSGRTDSSFDCSFPAYFTENKRYLIFVDLRGFKSYEEVVSTDDLWLIKVKSLVKSETLPTKKKLELIVSGFDEFKVGSPMLLDVSIRNISEEDIEVPAVMFPQDYWLLLELKDEKGNLIKYVGPEYKVAHDERVKIAPEMFYGKTIDLKEYYKLFKGEYRLQVTYGIGPDLNVLSSGKESKSIKFKVAN